MSNSQTLTAQDKLEAFGITVYECDMLDLTPRQQLIEATARTIAGDNVKTIMHNMGCVMLAPAHITFTSYIPTHGDYFNTKMNETIEGVARRVSQWQSSAEVWDYYLNASDTAYKRLYTAIVARYQELLAERLPLLREHAIKAYNASQHTRPVYPNDTGMYQVDRYYDATDKHNAVYETCERSAQIAAWHWERDNPGAVAYITPPA